jgi:hypothetical protein
VIKKRCGIEMQEGIAVRKKIQRINLYDNFIMM